MKFSIILKNYNNFTYLQNFPTKNKPNETETPTKRAYIIVPTPKIPPKKKPKITAVNSSIILINDSEYFVILFIPVISPSLGPGPKLAIK